MNNNLLAGFITERYLIMKNMKKRSLRRIFAGILGIGILLTGAVPCAAAAYGYDEYGDPIVTATPVPDGQAAAVTPAHSSYYSQAADTDSIDGWPKVPASKHRLQSLWT